MLTLMKPASASPRPHHHLPPHHLLLPHLAWGRCPHPPPTHLPPSLLCFHFTLHGVVDRWKRLVSFVDLVNLPAVFCTYGRVHTHVCLVVHTSLVATPYRCSPVRSGRFTHACAALFPASPHALNQFGGDASLPPPYDYPTCHHTALVKSTCRCRTVMTLVPLRVGG